MATAERLIIEAMFMIADKDGNDVDFHLNSAQVAVDSRLTGRDIIPKARQEGVSSYFLARNLAKCISRRNEHCVVISHEVEATQRMLGKVHYMIENMKGAKPVTGVSSKNEITFPKTNSTYYIGTAGSRKFGRGDTISSLHCSEVAFWPDPKTLTAGLFQAVPVETGEISMESTGNGKGNYYHRACMRAYKGGGRYRLHFLNWQGFKEYDLSVTPEEAEGILGSLDSDMSEPELVEELSLTAGQVKFRRLKLEELDYDQSLFKQEYPSSLEECFQSTGHSVFHKYNHIVADHWIKVDQHAHAMKDVYSGPLGKYIVGVDVGGGVGKDDSVIEVYDVVTMEQVCEWISDRTDPEVLASHVERLARWFNNAYVICESNNHGIATLMALKNSDYPSYLLYRSKEDTDNLIKYGYRTTTKTRPLLISGLRTEVKKNMTLHSPYSVDQLETFIETDSGKLEAESECKDDTVIANALCQIGRARAILMLGAPTPISLARPKEIDPSDPYSLDSALESIKQARDNLSDFPIKEQV